MSFLNVRIYGVLVNAQQQVLVSDEFIRGRYFTKFPGGGLEFGEGTLDCLRREWQEELQQEIEIVKHLYTTDFFQISAFDNHSQILSIYYVVKEKSPFVARTIEKPFDFPIPEGADDVTAPRWIPWNAFSEDSVSLPIDKVVARKIKRKGIAWLYESDD
ncbi:MAG: NUDIX domain-containing protein [Thermoflavifilum sp.]|uniref:NUDIX hydrolase n=1 Tax=Thermoflavifilum sp. TaxID=1968839 RepID=UPI0018A5E133|nr:NUDIX domain-containing protein [Thermoflavifilum sp.]QOR75418.1 MAG: NUDIX domain-containing protein [Thermoflavifilum sp.]